MRDAKALVAEVIISWVVKDYIGRVAGLELCPEAGHRGERSPKWRYGCQTTANPQFELELPACAESYFPISQPSCFPVSMEVIRTCGCKRKTCRAKSLPNR